MITLLLLLTLSGPPAQPTLERLAAALHAARGWQADFTQTYTPEGFAQGTSEGGTLTLVAPMQLRFDYTSAPARVFAVDGAVGRLVDPANGTCEAVRLDRGTWARLPLAAVLDPAAAERAFVITTQGPTIRLVPREISPELAQIELTLDPAALPRTVLVRDAAGNGNQFSFSRWRPLTPPPATFFQPSLAHLRPCLPEDS